VNKPIIIFGTGKIADVVYYYATAECGFEVAGFSVNESYLGEAIFNEKPVFAFETLETYFPPADYDLFVAIGYHNLNDLRAQICKEAIDKGYNLVSVVSPECKLPANVTYGNNCFIMPPSVIHPCVTLGNNVFVWSGALVGHHTVVGDHCWLTSHCHIGGNVQIGENSFVALNATVGHSVVLGNHCFLGANTLVIKNMEPMQVVIAESSKPIKMNSRQFLKFSSFTSL
jgi:sugar O-acyltransferase (sialic acid O-acetyltransferase NeuD family)